MESLKDFLSYAQVHRSLLEKAVSQGLKDMSETPQKEVPEAGSDLFGCFSFFFLLFFFQHNQLVSSMEIFTLCIYLSPLAICFSLSLTLSCSSYLLQVLVSSDPLLAVISFIQPDIHLGHY